MPKRAGAAGGHGRLCSAKPPLGASHWNSILCKFETNLATLRAAGQLPVMRLPLDYGKGWFVMEDLGHPMESLWRATHLLSLRASAELAKGLGEAAFQDVLLAMRLEELLSDGPLDHVQRYRRAMLQFCLQPVWEGLAARRWTGAQLAALQKKLAEVDMLDCYHQGARGQTLAMMNSCDQALAFVQGGATEKGRHLVWSQDGARFWPWLSSQKDERFWGWAARIFYPVGWFYQEKTLAFRFYQQYADPWKATQLRNQTPAQRWAVIRRFLADPLLGTEVLAVLRSTFEESSVDCLSLQTFLEQAATACALERFRLDQGWYPASLDALVPHYLDRVPPDLLAVAPAPLRYQQTPDAGFRLYSVGFNRVDDGGNPNPPADPRHNFLEQLSQGDSDLVWFQPGQH
jgi:hypothetical protein